MAVSVAIFDANGVKKPSAFLFFNMPIMTCTGVPFSSVLAIAAPASGLWPPSSQICEPSGNNLVRGPADSNCIRAGQRTHSIAAGKAASGTEIAD